MKIVHAGKSLLGEGPTWDEQRQRLFWLDGLGKLIHLFDPASGKNASFPVPQPVGSLTLTNRNDVLLLALQDGLYTLDITDGHLALYLPLETELPGNRFNDGKCDRAGRFWFGSMNTAANSGDANCAATGSVYCLERREVRKVFSGVTISNGLGWSPDNRRFYYIDSPLKAVAAFDFDVARGELSQRRVVVTLEEGLPDGLAVDAEGMLWVAIWGGYRVCRFDPRNGTCLAELRFPVKNITSCAFGGARLDELYVTSSSLEAEGTEREVAGALFHTPPGVRGTPSHRFVF